MQAIQCTVRFQQPALSGAARRSCRQPRLAVRAAASTEEKVEVAAEAPKVEATSQQTASAPAQTAQPVQKTGSLRKPHDHLREFGARPHTDVLGEQQGAAPLPPRRRCHHTLPLPWSCASALPPPCELLLPW